MRIRHLNHARQPELQADQPQQKKPDIPLPSSGGSLSFMKYHARKGMGRFLGLFKAFPGKDSRVHPGPASAQSQAGVPPTVAGHVSTKPLPQVPTAQRRRFDHYFSAANNGEARPPVPAHTGPDRDVQFSHSDLIPATVFKKTRWNFAPGENTGVPPAPVESDPPPDAGIQFSDSDLVPATVFKKDRRDSGIGLETDPPPAPVQREAMSDGDVQFSDSDLVPATVFKKDRRDSGIGLETDPPPAPVQPEATSDGGIQFSDSDLVPATVFKKDRPDSGIGLDDDFAIKHVDSDRVSSNTLESEVARPPYEPITLKSYWGCGGQNRAAVACTDYARQAAEMLIVNGKLDTHYAANMMVDASERQDLPAEFREHVIRTLQQLEESSKLARIVNSTCEHECPTGPAAGTVRATLNLPPDAPVTEADARKALVMALLGELRQENIGDCFAVAPAICLHADLPAVVAGNLKAMLEDNYLTFNSGGTSVQAPFNRSFSRAEAQVPLIATADGTCYGKASTGGVDRAYYLYETPGIRAALTALGIPETEIQYEVCAALYQMNPQDYGKRTVTSQAVIEHIARNRPGAGNPDKRISSALHAFSAQESVGLLRAWEFTMAAHGASIDNKRQADILVTKLLYGTPLSDRPDLQSLSARHTTFELQLASEPAFRRVPVGQIGVALFQDMEALMKKRFCRLYDPDFERKTKSYDGVSDRGGWVLYDRTPADDPAKWRRIDSAGMLQDAMADVVEAAHNRASREVGDFALNGVPADRQANRNALRRIADELVENILDDAFTEYAEAKFDTGGGRARNADNILLRGASGGYLDPIVENYGGASVHSKTISTKGTPDPSGSGPAASKDPDDATEAVKFLCEGLSRMSVELRTKRDQSHPGFRIPVENKSHGFTLLPQYMEGVWLRGNATPEEWMERSLEAPVMAHLQESRIKPPLHELLASIRAEIGANEQQMTQIYQQIAQHSMRRRDLQQPYTLQQVHDALKAHCGKQQDGSGILEKGEGALSQALPVPARLLADTNWADDQGNRRYLGALYNPYKQRVEMCTMDRAGGNRRIQGADWLEGRWELYSPLDTRAT
jgi:hypothetical protein